MSTRRPFTPLTLVLATSLVLAGCEVTEEFEPRPAEELAAEQHINDFVDALRDADYSDACERLTPSGYYHLVTGRQRSFPLDREVVDCEQKLALATRDVELNTLPRVEVESTTQRGRELIVETEGGDVWNLTASDYRITAVPR